MELIKTLVSQLGVNEDQASGGAGLVLGLVKDKLDGTQFGQIANVIPEAEQLIDKAPSGGAMGAIGGLIGKLGGDKAEGLGDLAELAGGFSKLDLDSDMIGKFGSTIIGFLEDKGAGDVLGLVKGFLK
ncbi:MAG: DUF2780 domain-containing protein [Phycisphaerales bacterium]